MYIAENNLEYLVICLTMQNLSEEQFINIYSGLVSHPVQIKLTLIMACETELQTLDLRPGEKKCRLTKLSFT